MLGAVVLVQSDTQTITNCLVVVVVVNATFSSDAKSTKWGTTFSNRDVAVLRGRLTQKWSFTCL